MADQPTAQQLVEQYKRSGEFDRLRAEMLEKLMASVRCSEVCFTVLSTHEPFALDNYRRLEISFPRESMK